MEHKVWVKALLIWVAILMIAIGNGILREAVLLDVSSTTTAFLLSGILLSCMIFGVTFLLLPWLGVRESRSLLIVGLGWLILTLVFEFSFALAQGLPISKIFEAYTFKEGNIWPVVVVVTAASPWIAAKLRRKLQKIKL